jgi:hypothetical protein
MDFGEKFNVLAAIFLSGIGFHQACFVRGEWHIQSAAVFGFYLLLLAMVAATVHHVRSMTLMSSLSTGFLFLSWHLAGLWSAMLVYRGMFHPLRRFPGPNGAKYSKFWHVWQCLDSRNHLVLDGLRTKYGDFVRTGPNELTIFHPDGLAVMSKPSVARGGWYDLIHPALSVNTVRDTAMHEQRRKLWESAFTTTGILMISLFCASQTSSPADMLPSHAGLRATNPTAC